VSKILIEDWNAKAAAIHDMRDDSTLIGSCQDADGNAERAPADGDNAQRGSPCDRAPADGGSEHPEEVLPNVTREEDVNAEIETAAGDVREVVEEAENNVGADQQVQHLSHFLFISVISFFISVIFYITPLSGSSKQCCQLWNSIQCARG
jgi:hypothetical protein